MSEDQITKLSRSLGKRLDKIDSKLTNHDESFEKMFLYMAKRFDGVDERFEKVDREIADVRGAIAELSAQVRDYHNESIMLSH